MKAFFANMTPTLLMPLTAICLITASSKVSGATSILFSTPTKISPTPEYFYQTTNYPPEYYINTHLQTTRGTRDTDVEGLSRFLVTIPVAGTLTISWDARMGNGDFDRGGNYASGGATSGYLGFWDINMRFFFSSASAAPTEIGTLDTGGPFINSITSAIYDTEGWFNTPNTNFNSVVPVIPGEYNFDAELQTLNAAGYGDIRNLVFTLDAVPEPTSPVLAASALVAHLMLRRRRNA